MRRHRSDHSSSPRPASDVTCAYVWTPGEQPCPLRTLVDSAEIALAIPDWPVQRDLLALVNDEGLVTAMLYDASPALKVRLREARGVIAGLDEPFSKVLLFQVVDEIVMEPITESQRCWYELQREVFESQGLELLDLFDVSTDAFRSYGVLEGAWADADQASDEG